MREDAISPVIGVILLVATAVVLSAVVFIAANNIASDTPRAGPPVTFIQDESGDRLTVPVRQEWTWSEARLHSSHSTIIVDRNDAAGLGDTVITDSGAELTGGRVTGGDYLAFCSVVPAEAVTITVTDTMTQSTFAVVLFDTIAAC